MPVSRLVGHAILITLRLTAPAAALSWLLALAAGVWLAAPPRHALLKRIAAAANSVLLALPDILIALVLMLAAIRTGWLPAGGMEPVDAGPPGAGRIVGAVRHMVIPVFTLVVSTAPLLIRQIHFSVQAALESPAVKTASALGLDARLLLWRYALPLAMNPLISLLGLLFGAQLSLSLLVEVVLGWPGVGPLVLAAVQARDLPLVTAIVLASGLLLLAGNLISDLLLVWSDPRIRRGEAL
jgi:peptide/nickel transport system permease protein